jgi:hypothetical protein
MKLWMKFSLYILINVLFVSNIFAQNEPTGTPQYKHVLKGYLTFLDDKKTTVLTDTFRTQTNTQNHSSILPTIGWSRLRKNGRFMEIGITKLSFDFQESKTENKVFQRDSFGNIVPAGDIPDRGMSVWTNNLGLRFEWNAPIFYRENADFQSFMGISVDPAFYYQKIQPVSSAAFGSRVFEFSNTITLIPRITYAVSNRLFLDLNVPISFITLNLNYNVVNNPTIPTNARERIDFRGLTPTNIYAIRFGIGYKI